MKRYIVFFTLWVFLAFYSFFSAAENGSGLFSLSSLICGFMIALNLSKIAKDE